MQRSPRTHPRSRLKPAGAALRSRGFTLLEMMLVLAVLAVAAALAFPSMTRLYQDYKLKDGAGAVQTRLVSARVHAIDEGIEYFFRYEPGGNRFLVLPEYEAPAAQGLGSVTSAAQAAAPKRWKGAGILPSGVTFAANSSDTAVSEVPDEWLSGLPDAADFTGAKWSQPILFSPNGSAEAGEVEVVDSRKLSIRVSIRPLTGSVSMSPVATAPK